MPYVFELPLQSKRLGYKITTCNDPLKALQQFKAQPESFDLVITDMTMPGMTGDELAVNILAIRPDMPVILHRVQLTYLQRESESYRHQIIRHEAGHHPGYGNNHPVDLGQPSAQLLTAS